MGILESHIINNSFVSIINVVLHVINDFFFIVWWVAELIWKIFDRLAAYPACSFTLSAVKMVNDCTDPLSFSLVSKKLVIHFTAQDQVGVYAEVDGLGCGCPGYPLNLFIEVII